MGFILAIARTFTVIWAEVHGNHKENAHDVDALTFYWLTGPWGHDPVDLTFIDGGQRSQDNPAMLYHNSFTPDSRWISLHALLLLLQDGQHPSPHSIFQVVSRTRICRRIHHCRAQLRRAWKGTFRTCNRSVGLWLIYWIRLPSRMCWSVKQCHSKPSWGSFYGMERMHVSHYHCARSCWRLFISFSTGKLTIWGNSVDHQPLFCILFL